MPQGSYQSHEEKQLLSLLSGGDRQAFGEIYRRHARELLTRAYQKTGIREVSEDMVQDVFAALWMQRARVEIRQSPGAYLQGVLDNKIVDYYRKICTQLRHLDQLNAAFDQPDISPADQLAYKEQDSALQGYIAGLSEKMRNIFLLSRNEQLSSQEISRRLNLSNQTVRNQISKALKILREKMRSA